MSKADIMGLGPFLKALGERLDGMTKEEICRVLVQRGKKDYSRRPAFRREIEALVRADK